MRYLTLDDIKLAIPIKTLVALSNDDPRATDISLSVIERAVRASEEMIDANLRGRYNLPLATVPTVITDACIALVRHWLYARRPEGSELPDAVVRTFNAAMKTLADIRDGKLTIGVPSGQAAPEPGAYKVRAPARRFINGMADDL
jgi:phage gp36-like protein